MGSIKIRKIIIRMSNFFSLIVFKTYNEIHKLILLFILMIPQTCLLTFDMFFLMFDMLASLALLYIIFDFAGCFRM